jgi:hypothetical protein
MHLIAINFIICRKFPVLRKTLNLKVPYYVKENFHTEYQGSLRRLEITVEEEYVTNLRHSCYREKNYRKYNCMCLFADRDSIMFSNRILKGLSTSFVWVMTLSCGKPVCQYLVEISNFNLHGRMSNSWSSPHVYSTGLQDCCKTVYTNVNHCLCTLYFLSVST